MSVRGQFDRKWLSRAGIGFILSAVLLAAFPAPPALAYAGGYGLSFAGSVPDSNQVLQVNTTGVFGPLEACRSTKSISVWLRPTGSVPAGNASAEVSMAVSNSPIFFGISRGPVNAAGGLDRIWVFNYSPQVAPMEQRIGIPYTVGEWVHITMVHSGDTLYAYKNGVLAGSVASGPTAGAGCGKPSVGAYWQPNQVRREWLGQIDEVQIWRTALTESEIRAWMNRELNSTHPQWASLAAYYQMSNGSGTTVTDDSPNTYDGTLLNNVAWVPSAALAGPRNALWLDGADEYATVPENAALDQSSGMTFEAWASPGNWDNNTRTPLAAKGNAAFSELNYYFGKSDTNKLMFSYYNGGLVDVVDTSSVSINNGAWYHVAYVVDVANNKIRFYQDGILLSEVSHNFSGTPLLANDRDLTLASYLGSADAFYSGLIDEVRIWNTPLTQVAIRDNMFQTLKGDESGLAAYYRFDQYNSATQTTLFDSGLANLHGSLHNIEPALDWVASTPFNTWVGVESTAWATAGNWSRNEVPSGSHYVGIHSFPSGSITTISGAESAANVVVGSTGNLVVTSSGSLSVGGRLFNNGRMQQTLPVSGSTDVAFLSTGSYGGVLINPNTDDLGSTTVVIEGNQDCTTTAGDTVRRCFDITPTSNNSSINKTVTFFFDSSEESGNDCVDLEAYHHIGGGIWSALSRNFAYGTDGRLCGADPRSVQVNNVSTFSAFALNESLPTSITLVSFSGTSRSGSIILGVAAFFVLALFVLVWLRKKQRAY